MKVLKLGTPSARALIKDARTALGSFYVQNGDTMFRVATPDGAIMTTLPCGIFELDPSVLVSIDGTRLDKVIEAGWKFSTIELVENGEDSALVFKSGSGALRLSAEAARPTSTRPVPFVQDTDLDDWRGQLDTRILKKGKLKSAFNNQVCHAVFDSDAVRVTDGCSIAQFSHRAETCDVDPPEIGMPKLAPFVDLLPASCSLRIQSRGEFVRFTTECGADFEFRNPKFRISLAENCKELFKSEVTEPLRVPIKELVGVAKTAAKLYFKDYDSYATGLRFEHGADNDEINAGTSEDGMTHALDGRCGCSGAVFNSQRVVNALSMLSGTISIGFIEIGNVTAISFSDGDKTEVRLMSITKN